MARASETVSMVSSLTNVEIPICMALPLSFGSAVTNKAGSPVVPAVAKRRTAPDGNHYYQPETGLTGPSGPPGSLNATAMTLEGGHRGPLCGDAGGRPRLDDRHAARAAANPEPGGSH